MGTMVEEKEAARASPQHGVEQNSALTRIGKYSLVGVSTGALCGTVLATYRGGPIPFYALSVAANFGLASLTFFGSEALIHRVRGGKRDAWGYTGAGGLTGLVMTVPIGGRYRALASGVAMAGLGYGSFFASHYVQEHIEIMGQERLRERAAQARGQSTEQEANRLETGLGSMRARK